MVEIREEHHPDGSITRHPVPGTEACDFCSSDSPTYDYPCKSFEYPDSPGEVSHGSLGGWLACDPCAELIEADDTDGLAARSLAEYERRRGPVPGHIADLKRILVGIHKAFFDNRQGGRVPWPNDREDT